MADKSSILITLAIMAILVMASPTQADVNVSDTPASVTLGDSFEFDLEIADAGTIDFLDVSIKREGDELLLCDFEPKGNNLKKAHPQSEEMPPECRGIKIMKPGKEYGYGYGGYRYRLRIETNKGYVKEHGAGDYTLIVSVNGGAGGSDTFNVVVEEPVSKNNENNGNGKKK